MLDMTCLAVDVLVTRRDHLQKSFIMSHIAATPVQCLRRELLLYDKQSFSGTNSGIRKWVLGHLCLPLGSLFTKVLP